MSFLSWLKQNGKWLINVLLFVTFAIPILADIASSKTTGSNTEYNWIESIWATICSFCLDYKYWLLIPFGVALLAVRIIEGLDFGVRRKQVKAYLDLLHKTFFASSDGEISDSERTTVFLPKKSGNEKVLCVFARSGFQNQNSKTTWSITRSESNGQYDGIAGAAWVSNGLIRKDDLPDIDDPKCSDTDKDKYCQETFVSKERLNSLSWHARSYRAIVVQDQKGNRVAVIMLESKKPDGLRIVDYQRMLVQIDAYRLFMGIDK